MSMDTYELKTNAIMKEVFVNKMRNAWNQKRFRDSKNVDTAIDHIFTKKDLNTLYRVAEAYGVTPLEMLKELIRERYEKVSEENKK